MQETTGWEVRAGPGPRGGSGGQPGLCGPCSHPLGSGWESVLGSEKLFIGSSNLCAYHGLFAHREFKHRLEVTRAVGRGCQYLPGFSQHGYK